MGGACSIINLSPAPELAPEASSAFIRPPTKNRDRCDRHPQLGWTPPGVDSLGSLEALFYSGAVSRRSLLDGVRIDSENLGYFYSLYRLGYIGYSLYMMCYRLRVVSFLGVANKREREHTFTRLLRGSLNPIPHFGPTTSERRLGHPIIKTFLCPNVACGERERHFCRTLHIV